MKIILDGMGGDNAPAEIVKGAVQAVAEISDEIIIVGELGAILEELENNGYQGEQISVKAASELITMEDSPVKAIRTKTDSSLVVAFNMLKDGEGDMLVSAGNTGAIMVGARLILGRIRGIDRPALASIFPNMNGDEPNLLVDAGASSESKAINLLEYALMGSTYVEKVWGRDNPRVGLVNLGTEESKGTSVTKDAYQMILNSHMNFVGNVEGRDLPKGVCDVIVCDGFTGNVILKLTEGLAMSIFKLIKETFRSGLKNMIGGAFAKSGLTKLKEEFDYEEYGGAPVLGVNGPVIKMHGSSNAKAVKSAILRGLPYARENVVDIIRQEMLQIDEYIEEEED
ncbi:MAG: phosphate acyltransferase PlsX [Eubacteriales bacterium]|nr:phosphate acyltransferase PlsX [Eubacteriales bacterium]